MELEVLIRQLQTALYEADEAMDAGERDEAREHLREAKDLLDAEFLKD